MSEGVSNSNQSRDALGKVSDKEEALRESEARFRALADNIPQLAWMTDGEGWIHWYNQRWFDYTGTTLSEMQGWGWQKVHHPDYVEAVTEKFRVHVQRGEPWEDTFPLRGADGAYRWFLSRAVPSRDESGKVILWCGTNTDVTEERERRAEREALLAQMDAVLSCATDGIIVTDLAGNSLMWNPAALAMHGYGDFEEARHSLADFADTFVLYDRKNNAVGQESTPLALSEWPLSRVMRGETFTDYELFVERFDTGAQWWASYSGAPARDGNGVPILLVLTVRNVSVRKLLEARQEALVQQLAEAATNQRRFLREMLFGLTEGHLRLCDTADELPAPLAPAGAAVELTPLTLRLLRQEIESVAEGLRFPSERRQDLLTAASEAAMNAVRHAGFGTGSISADVASGTLQVWVHDSGKGIDEHLIHRAIEQGWTTGGFGQGFYLMWRCADRLYLLTGPTGTTIVMEQDCMPPLPAWMDISNIS